MPMDSQPEHPDPTLRLRRAPGFDASDPSSYCWACTKFDSSYAHQLLLLTPDRIRIQDRTLHRIPNFVYGSRDAVTVDAQLQDVLEAAREGCDSCVLLRECVLAFKGQHFLQHAEDAETSVTYTHGASMIVHVRENSEGVWHAYELFVDEGKIARQV